MSVLQATELRRLETYRDGLRADLQQAMRIGREEGVPSRLVPGAAYLGPLTPEDE